MTHVVELEISRFYKVYVEDQSGSMTRDQIIKQAKRMAIDDENNLTLDEEIEIEQQDIVRATYEYDIDD